jgi:hypothetical protein
LPLRVSFIPHQTPQIEKGFYKAMKTLLIRRFDYAPLHILFKEPKLKLTNADELLCEAVRWQEKPPTS